MDTYSSSINGSLLQKLATSIILAVAFFISAGAMVYLSLRSKEVKVPDLIGKAESDAEKILSNEGLRFKVRNRTTDDKVQANLISEQIPTAGATVKAGQVINVTISTGIEAKKEGADAEAKPSATATPKPKPKPKPSTSPTAENDKAATSSNEVNKTAKDTASKAKEAEKAPNKGAGEPGKGKPSLSPVGKGKPSPSPSVKASPKPSPKKPGIN